MSSALFTCNTTTITVQYKIIYIYVLCLNLFGISLSVFYLWERKGKEFYQNPSKILKWSLLFQELYPETVAVYNGKASPLLTVLELFLSLSLTHSHTHTWKKTAKILDEIYTLQSSK